MFTVYKLFARLKYLLSSERSKNPIGVMFNLLPNVQNPACQGSLTDTAMLISELTRFDSFYIFSHGTPRVFTM